MEHEKSKKPLGLFVLYKLRASGLLILIVRTGGNQNMLAEVGTIQERDGVEGVCVCLLVGGRGHW